jgi:protein-disulfide isomerase
MQVQSAPKLVVPVSERDHLRGSATAPLTLVEYGDYQCPSCGAAHPIVTELRRALGSRMRFVFRNFPLTQIHSHAQDAAETAELAGTAGKFWEMHDLLFEHQDALEREDLGDYAAELGIHPERVRSALRNGDFSQRIREDFLSGARSGVNGTPTFFIQGERYDGSADFESLLRALEAAEAG